jgi:hypothetical protein
LVFNCVRFFAAPLRALSPTGLFTALSPHGAADTGTPSSLQVPGRGGNELTPPAARYCAVEAQMAFMRDDSSSEEPLCA